MWVEGKVKLNFSLKNDAYLTAKSSSNVTSLNQ